jgi:hypothetical protein
MKDWILDWLLAYFKRKNKEATKEILRQREFLTFKQEDLRYINDAIRIHDFEIEARGRVLASRGYYLNRINGLLEVIEEVEDK